ncbi:MAG: biotin--[acetyl-CoA-carboxylase] ligase [Pseudomonadota bacterium]
MTSILGAALAQPWPALWYETLDSTNEEARRRASQGDFGPAWIAARQQSAGRGRRGRDWISPAGNLFTTALFPFDRTPEDAALLCFSTGLAVIDALDALGADTAGVGLKWPNDVRRNQAKLCGILIETGTASSGLMWIAAGVGVNVATAPSADQASLCVKDLQGGEDASAASVLDALSEAFRVRVSQLLTGGFDPVRQDWLKRSEGMGRRVVAKPGNDTVEGVMEGLGEDGALILRLDSGAQRRITAGEVSLVA